MEKAYRTRSPCLPCRGGDTRREIQRYSIYISPSNCYQASIYLLSYFYLSFIKLKSKNLDFSGPGGYFPEPPRFGHILENVLSPIFLHLVPSASEKRVKNYPHTSPPPAWILAVKCSPENLQKVHKGLLRTIFCGVTTGNLIHSCKKGGDRWLQLPE